MNVAHPWARINENNDAFEVVVRKFINEKNDKRVVLISMVHVGLPEYYQTINNLINGKTVIYESMGTTWSEIRRQSEAFKALDDIHGKRWRMVNPDMFSCLAAHRNLVLQYDHLNYDNVRELIHADEASRVTAVGLTPWGDEDANDWVDKRVRESFHAHGRSQTQELDLDEMASIYFQEIGKGIPDLKTLASILNSPPQLSIEHDTKLNVKRNPMVIKAIENALENSDEVDVTYGFNHFPVIEHFLISVGFKHRVESDIWMPVFRF